MPLRQQLLVCDTYIEHPYSMHCIGAGACPPPLGRALALARMYVHAATIGLVH